MISIRKSQERGHANHDWLESYHTFSFADYHDPAHVRFSALRVINEDRVAPGGGFGTHPHRDMEIISYVLDGALEHKDSMGNGSVIRPGDVQRMSAGTGVTHSEYNHSEKELVHFLQIWILPQRTGLPPSYEQISVPDEEKRGRLRLIAAGKGQDGAVTLHQDVELYASMLDAGESVSHDLQPGRSAWAQVARGRVTVNGHRLEAGDGLALKDEPRLDIRGEGKAEVLLFDLP